MPTLTSERRRALRARAHSLNPVVSIAQQGLSESVIKEIDVCLKAHELIKIRVYSDVRDEREGYLAEICRQLDAAPVQHIGKLLVVWRPQPAEDANAGKSARRPPRTKEGPRRTKRSLQGHLR